MYKKILLCTLYSFTACLGMEPSKPSDGDEKHITGPTRPTYQPRMSEATPLLRASDAAHDVACAICLNEHIVGAQITLPCGHSFCESCINRWRAAHSGATCPYCRAGIPPAVGADAGLVSPFAVIPAAQQAHNAEHLYEIDLHPNQLALPAQHPVPAGPNEHAADDDHAVAQNYNPPALAIYHAPAAPINHHHVNRYHDPVGACCSACWRNSSICCDTCCETCDRHTAPCRKSSSKAYKSCFENYCYCCCCGSEDNHVPNRVACCYCCCVEHPQDHFAPSNSWGGRWHERNSNRCCGPLEQEYATRCCAFACITSASIGIPLLIFCLH